MFAAIDRADRPYDADPAVARKRRASWRRDASRPASRSGDAARRTVAKAGGRSWPSSTARSPPPASRGGRKPPEFGYHSGIAPKPDAIKWVQVDLGRAVDARPRRAAGGCHDDFNNIGAGFGFPVRFKIEVSRRPGVPDGRRRDRRPARRPTCPTPASPRRPSPAGGASGRYVRVTATKLAPRQNDYIFALAELEVLDAAGKNLAAGRDRDGARLDRGARRAGGRRTSPTATAPGRADAGDLAQLSRSAQALVEPRSATTDSPTALAAIDAELADVEARAGEAAAAPGWSTPARSTTAAARSAAPGPTAASRGRSTSCRAAT